TMAPAASGWLTGEFKTITRYDGLVTTITESPGAGASRATRRLTHDALGRLIRVEEQLDDGSFAVTRYGYDGAGNLAEILDPEGRATHLVHDRAGRRTQITSDGRVWRYGYDDSGNMTH